MKNYIFLNSTIANIGGAEVYISHKCDHLKTLGYKVFVFSFERGNVVLKNLKVYDAYVLPELKVMFRRSNAKIRRTVLEAFMNLHLEGDVIIESNIDNLNLWGEYIAKKIGAYHICFLLPEKNIMAAADVPFYEFKYKREQLYGIKERLITDFFNNGKEYPNTHLKAVGCNTGTVSEGDSIEIKGFIETGCTILSLGRLNKPYISTMLDAIRDFAKEHTTTNINLLIVGGYMQTNVQTKIDAMQGSNVRVFLLGELNPVPQNLFSLSDAAIAVSGCARICSRQGVPTITVDGNDLQGIGVLNYTTNNSIFREDEPKFPIKKLLSDILLKKKYPKTEPIPETNLINYTVHDSLLDYKKPIEFYDVSCHPDSIISLAVKVAICILGVKRYYMLLSKWQRKKRLIYILLCLLLLSVSYVLAVNTIGSKYDGGNIGRKNMHKSTLYKKSQRVKFGMNVHPALMYWDYPVFDEVLKHLKYKNTEILRIDAYYDQGNTRLLKGIYSGITKGYDILLYFPQCNPSIDQEKYVEYIEYLATVLDGTHLFDCQGKQVPNGTPLCVRYFEITNEPDLKKGLSVEDWFTLYRKCVERVRTIRDDIFFVAPALGYYPLSGQYWRDMCAYVDKDGVKLSDLCDIISAHIYVDDDDELIYKRLNKQLYEGFKQDTHLLNKPLWITETGMSSFEFLDKERAKHSVIQNIYLLSTGASALFYYQYYSYGINNLIGQDTKESGYHVIPHASNTSTAHFYVNDGSRRPLSSGDALKDVTVCPQHNDYIWFQVHSDHPSDRKNFVYKNLKKTGIEIDGDGFCITSIEIYSDKTLQKRKSIAWIGNFKTGRNPLRVPPSAFSDLDDTDFIKVNIKDAIIDENYSGSFKKTMTDEALSVLYTSLSNDFSGLRIEDSSNVKKAYFKNGRSENVYILWANTPTVQYVRYTGKVTSAFDFIGNPLRVKKRQLITDAPIYIVGPEEIFLSTHK